MQKVITITGRAEIDERKGNTLKEFLPVELNTLLEQGYEIKESILPQLTSTTYFAITFILEKKEAQGEPAPGHQ